MTDAASPAAAPAAEPEAPRNAIAAIVAKAQAKEAARAAELPAEGAEPVAGDKPAGDAAKAEPADGEPEKKPEPKTDESKGLSLKHAKLQTDHKQLQATHETIKAELGTAKGEIEELKTLGKRNPLKLAERLSGLTLKQIVENGARGHYDERGLPPEVQAELDESRKFREEAKAREAAREAEAGRADDIRIASDFMKGALDKYPIFAAAPWAAEELVDRAMDAAKNHRDIDLHELAAEAEAAAVGNLQKMAGNASLMAAVAKNAELRQSFAQALGLAATNTAQRPASRTSGASEPGTGSRTLSQKDTQESPVPSPDVDNDSDTYDEAEMLTRLRNLKQKGRIV